MTKYQLFTRVYFPFEAEWKPVPVPDFIPKDEMKTAVSLIIGVLGEAKTNKEYTVRPDKASKKGDAHAAKWLYD